MLIETQFDTSILYVLSPYDCLAQIGQRLLGIDSNYNHPLAFSLVSIITINAACIALLVARVSSLEVTRE
jgi:hypothetical protein